MSSEERHHPVLPEAHRFEVVGIRLELAPEDGGEPFIDLTLRRAGARRTLRFFGPTSVEIVAPAEGGTLGGGLRILEVPDRQLDWGRVRVDSFEQGPAVRFWARDVAPI